MFKVDYPAPFDANAQSPKKCPAIVASKCNKPAGCRTQKHFARIYDDGRIVAFNHGQLGIMRGCCNQDRHVGLQSMNDAAVPEAVRH